jgi:ribosomal protein S27E
MKTNVFIGHHCPKCRTTIGTYASVGTEDPRCPGCGGPLVAGPGGPEVTVIANAKCTSCDFSAGLYSAVGGDSRCPKCGAKLEGQ